MEVIKYNKIIRDKIKNIIEADGKIAITQIVTGSQKLALLNAKLLEELEEYYQSNSLEELADIVEVIHGILHSQNLSWEQLEKLRLEKREKRGGFEAGRVLLEVREGDDLPAACQNCNK